ncbi:MAG: SpoIVB peptidase [Ruminococcaceae bacterium]|nr:SpoIVB peptidase [Oscillospiraceae bacterium]
MRSNKIKRIGSFLLIFLFIITVLILPTAGATKERPCLFVGGIPFGVRFVTDGVLVVGYCDVPCGGKPQNPAKAAGLCPGDCIYQVNGKEIKNAAELSAEITKNGQTGIEFSYRREGQERNAQLVPLPCDSDGKLRTGLFVRDSGAGIGTVTFVTDHNTFGGLGHGICDGESGALIPLSRGSVMGVTIGGLSRGAVGSPGELKGHFSADRIGVLTQNTPCGVFGSFTDRPALPAGKLPIAYRNEVHDGAVTLWCTLDDNTPREYTAEISCVHHTAQGNKCFTIHVTDKELLAKTGGIIQGMSGSPIIQDGHLIGAVTHVLIGDPTTGYGIFIENMLSNMAVPLS